MKTMVERAFTFLLLGVVILGGTAGAQRAPRTIKADIPFDFSVGSRVFPAGSYSVVRIDASLVELRDSRGRLLLNSLTQPVQSSTRPARAKLEFANLDGRHILTQVWQEGEMVGQEILESKSAVHAVQKRPGHVQTAEAGNPR